MFNSTNLPLEEKKIIKKTLESVPMFLLLFLVVFGGALGFNFLLPELNLWWAPLIAFILVISYGIGVYVYQIYYYKFYFYDFKEDSAEVKKGVISQSTGHVRYERIQNIFVDQDVLDRIFGLFDVHYETAGETSGIYSHVDGLNKENSEKLVEFLNERLNGADKKNTQAAESVKTEVKSANMETTGEVIDRTITPISSKIVIMNSVIASFSSSFFLLIVAGRFIFDSGYSYTSAYLIFIPLIIFILIWFVTFIYYKIWYNNFYFQFSDKSGVIKSQVIALSNSYVYYDRIQNINVTQGIIERIFGLFSVTIETAGESNKNIANSGLKISGLSKDDAEKIKNFLLAKVDVNHHKL